MGIPREEILVWDPFLPDGGNTPDAIKKARLLLWKGHCSVHQMFQPAHVRYFREKRSEEHTSELQSRLHLVCRLLLEKKKKHRATACGTRQIDNRAVSTGHRYECSRD